MRHTITPRRPHAVGTVATAALAALSLVAVGAAPAAAADDPPPVSHGSVFYDDFSSGTGSWAALNGQLSDWTVSDDAHPVASIDTMKQASGDYIGPAASVVLPEMYQLTTTLRVDDAASDATISLILDMAKSDDIHAQNVAVQFGAFDGNGHATVQVASPLGKGNLCKGASPISKGEWHTVVITRAGGVIAARVDGALVAAEPSGDDDGAFSIGSYHSAYSIGAVSVDALSSVPSGQPSSAQGCPWTPPVTPPDEGTGTGTVSGSGQWTNSAPASGDAPGHEVVSGEATIDLDGGWQFTTDPKRTGEDQNYPDPATNTSSWDSMTVPGNWDVRDAYGQYKGAAWYKRTFQTGDLSADAHQHAILRFDAVYWDATVWLNGKRLGSHSGGYTPFEFDVSKYLVDGANTLVVRADNSWSQGAWWAWGGISRDVTLIRTGDVVMDHQEVVAKPDLLSGTATVTSTVTLRNWSDEDATATVSGRVTDAARTSTIAHITGITVTVAAGSTANVTMTTELGAGQFALWDLDDPNLYRFEATVDGGDRGTEVVSDRFGIRSIVIDGTSILLNGQKVKLAGANRVADDPIEGNTEPVALVRRDLDRMKAAGMNMMRIMHHPQAPDLLDYADEIGMLIIAETPEWGVHGQQLINDLPRVQAQTQEAANRDFNHPSIFAYSVANEIGSNDQYGVEYDKTMAQFVHSMDPSRYVTQVSNQIGSITSGDQDGSQFMDFVSVNMYGGFAGAVDHAHAMYPGVPIFVSEYSPDGYTFGIDRQTLDFTTGSGDASNPFRSRDFVAGWSQWTFNDYRSDYSGSSPDLVRGWGDIDVWGRLKKAYDVVQTANAPVSSLKLADYATSDGASIGVAQIVPRGTADTDGPVFNLSGYSLVLRVTDAKGSVIGGSITPLADIAPGSPERDVPVTWNDGGKGVVAELTLLSPTGFEIATSTTALVSPSAPTITDTVAAATSIRVRYTGSSNVPEYRAEAVDGQGKVVASVTTAESFADLTGLSKNTSYTVRVSAVNDAGASGPDTAAVSTVGDLAMAPKLDALTPVQNGLVLGFSDNTRSAMFEVKVDNASTGQQVQDYTTANRPGTRIEGLTAGTAYDVSIRRLDDGDGAATAWSEPMRGIPNGDSTKPTLDVDGVVAGATTAGVVIEPQAGVERYRIDLSGPGGDRSIEVEHAAISLLPISGLTPDSTYSLSVTSESATGDSPAWTGTVTTSDSNAAPGVPVDVAFENRGNDVYLTWQAAVGDVPDGYIVTRTACGTTTTMIAAADELKLGTLSSSAGIYTVTAFRSGLDSTVSGSVTVPGDAHCAYVITPDDTTARDDGSVPFSKSAGWLESSVLGVGGYPSVYAEVSSTPDASATWTAPNRGDVRFKVEASLPDSYATSSAKYTLHTADGDKSVIVNQEEDANTWVDLGEYGFSGETPGNVTLHDGSGGYLRASAVRFTVVGGGQDVSAPVPTMANQTVVVGSPIVGTGTSVGDAITVTDADGAVLGTAVVGADFSWSVVPSLAVGVWDGVTVMEKDAVGWTGTATATISVIAVDDGSGSDLSLTVTPSRVRPGEHVLVIGSGFTAGESVEIVLHSDPRTLATVKADADGAVSENVTIPDDTTPGTHRLVLSGADSGEVSAQLTVLDADSSGGATGTPGAPGHGGGSTADSSGLADTGSSVDLALSLGILLAALGAGALIATRRRRERRQ